MVVSVLSRWAEALRSETKKHRDVLTKLEENIMAKIAEGKPAHNSTFSSLESKACGRSSINTARPQP